MLCIDFAWHIAFKFLWSFRELQRYYHLTVHEQLTNNQNGNVKSWRGYCTSYTVLLCLGNW